MSGCPLSNALCSRCCWRTAGFGLCRSSASGLLRVCRLEPSGGAPCGEVVEWGAVIEAGAAAAAGARGLAAGAPFAAASVAKGE
eukprot:scaffold149152_cov13-Tisochrysis_lutea.AAC.1